MTRKEFKKVNLSADFIKYILKSIQCGKNNESAKSGRTMECDFPRMLKSIHINSKKLTELFTPTDDEVEYIDDTKQYSYETHFKKIGKPQDVWRECFKRAGTTQINEKLIDELTINCNQAGYSGAFYFIYGENLRLNATKNSFISDNIIKTERHYIDRTNCTIHIAIDNIDTQQDTPQNSIKISINQTYKLICERKKDKIFPDSLFPKTLHSDKQTLCEFTTQINFALQVNNKDEVEYKNIELFMSNIPDTLDKIQNELAKSINLEVYQTPQNGLSIKKNLDLCRKGKFSHLIQDISTQQTPDNNKSMLFNVAITAAFVFVIASIIMVAIAATFILLKPSIINDYIISPAFSIQITLPL